MATQFPDDVLLSLEGGFPTAAQEKTLSPNTAAKEASSKYITVRPPPDRMILLSTRFLLVMVFLVMGYMTLVSAVPNLDLPPMPCRQAEHEAPVGPAVDIDESSFSRLLDTVSPESLHDLLHRYFPKTYRHGVYPDDQAALEAVYRANAPLATTLAKMAKRQDVPSNGTTTPPPPDTSTTSTTPPPTTGTTPPIETTTTTTKERRPTSELTSTPPPNTTKPPPKSQRRVTSTFTSTDANGRPTVVTATSYVVEVPPTSTRPSGSLQTDAAPLHNRGLLLKAVAGVVVGGVLLA